MASKNVHAILSVWWRFSSNANMTKISEMVTETNQKKLASDLANFTLRVQNLQYNPSLCKSIDPHDGVCGANFPCDGFHKLDFVQFFVQSFKKVNAVLEKDNDVN